MAPAKRRLVVELLIVVATGSALGVAVVELLRWAAS